MVIHDLNLKGGQDRCTLEIAKHLSHQVPVDIFAYTFTDFRPEQWGTVSFHPIKPLIRRPLPIKDLWFQQKTGWLKSTLAPHTQVHAAGACTTQSDVIHVHFVQSAWNETQASPYHQMLRKYKVAMERAIFTNDKKFIAISSNIKDELIHHLDIKAENIAVIPHGVNNIEFQPQELADPNGHERQQWRHQHSIDEKDFHVLFAGALNERKGLSLLLRALALFHNPKIKLSVVGGGNPQSFKKLSRELELSDRVNFLGPQSTMAPIYRSADAVVMPSMYEPFGLVGLEALACGVPLVVSENAGVCDILTNQSDSLFLPQNPQPQNIHEILQELFENPEKALSLRNEGLKTASARPWSLVAKEYLHAF